MPTVRTTMQPDREIDVDAAEYLDLQRQGLLVEELAAQEPAPQTAAPVTPAPIEKKPTSTAKSN